MKDYIKYGRLSTRKHLRNTSLKWIGVMEAMAGDMGAEQSALRVCIRDRRARLEQNGGREATGCRRPAVCFTGELRGHSSRAAFYGDLVASANGELPWVLARSSQSSQAHRRPIFLTPFPLACSFRAVLTPCFAWVSLHMHPPWASTNRMTAPGAEGVRLCS